MTEDEVKTELERLKELYKSIWSDSSTLKVSYHELEQSLTKILSYYPNSPIALANLGAILCDLGRYKEALPKLILAEKIGFSESSLSTSLGVAKRHIYGETDEVLNYFRTAHSLPSNDLVIEAYFDPQAT